MTRSATRFRTNVRASKRLSSDVRRVDGCEQPVLDPSCNEVRDELMTFLDSRGVTRRHRDQDVALRRHSLYAALPCQPDGEHVAAARRSERLENVWRAPARR